MFLNDLIASGHLDEPFWPTFFYTLDSGAISSAILQ